MKLPRLDMKSLVVVGHVIMLNRLWDTLIMRVGKGERAVGTDGVFLWVREEMMDGEFC